MENRTEISLNDRLKQWRASFQDKAELSKDNLDELESHLLDEIDDLTQNGLTEMEAFLVAKHRIGGKEEVSTEYKKVNKLFYFMNKLKPYLIGALFLIALKASCKIFVAVLFTMFLILKGHSDYEDFMAIRLYSTIVFILIFSFILIKKLNSDKKNNSNILVYIFLSTPLFIFMIYALQLFEPSIYGGRVTAIDYISMAVYVISALSFASLTIHNYIKSKNQKLLVEN